MPISSSTGTTILDVARKAGVSRSTISRILNNRPDVSESTRKRVLEVIEELGYSPHAQAQRLAAGKSYTIAMLHPIDYTHGFSVDEYMDFVVMGFMFGVARAGEEQGYYFNFLTRLVTKEDLLALYQGAHIDGVILMQIDMQDWRVDFLREYDLPFVMIGRRAENTGLNFVDVDFETGAMTAFTHLTDLGHEHIGFLTFSNTRRQAGYGPAVHSWQGYQQAIEQFGLNAYYREADSTKTIHESTQSLWQEYPHLTAVVVFNTTEITTVINALNRLGKRIPEDVSVVGFCLDKMTELMIPHVTALGFPSYEMGYLAANMLIQKLEDKNPESEQIMITPKLVIRDSTAPVRSS